MQRSWLLLIAAIALALGAVSCGDDDDGGSDPTSTPSALSWEMVAGPDAGGFPQFPGGSDSPAWEPGRFPMGLSPIEAFGSDLWMVSQINVYSSSDGIEWQQFPKTDTGSLLSPTYAFFDDKLWLFGGMTVPLVGGYADVKPEAFQTAIWNSADGKTWTHAGNAAWPGRSGATVVTYQDKLWLFGGANHVDEHGGADQFLDDVWASDDGLTWELVTDAPGWSPRNYPQVVPFNDELYLVGGQGVADVWRSADGEDWTRLTEEADWKDNRYGYGAVAFEGRLWVYGGYIGESTETQNDVWSSADGEEWTLEEEHAPWSPRDPANTIVWHDGLWIFSGKATGSDPIWKGDIWVMS